MIVLETQLIVIMLMALSVKLSIMLINHQIIPINDQMMHTKAIMVPIFMTEIVVFQISLRSNHLKFRKL